MLDIGDRVKLIRDRPRKTVTTRAAMEKGMNESQRRRMNGRWRFGRARALKLRGARSRRRWGGLGKF
jgi:hypothetical protein